MVINEYRYTHISKSDGVPLSVLRIEPDDNCKIKGIVQLVHGMVEHKERYVTFMKYLAEHGYITVIHDHRGHGESVRSKNDYGYFYKGGYEALIEDIHEITLETKIYAENERGLVISGNDGVPYTLLGHSMGSLAVRCYIKQYDKDIDRLCVVGCPSNKPGVVPGLIIVNLLKLLKGDKEHSKFMDFLVMDSNYGNKFKDEGPGAWLCSNPDLVAEYAKDPLSGFNFTINGYENLLKLTKETYSPKGYAMNNPDLKIKFFSGKDDPCAVSVKAFRNAMLLLKHQGYKNVSGKMYKGMRHEILNEIDKERVYKDILDFIK